MVDKCRIDFDKATDGALSKEEQDAIWKNLNEEAKQRQQRNKQSKVEALNSTLQDIQDMEARAAMVEKRNIQINALISKQLDDAIASFNNPVEGIQSLLIGLRADIKGARSNSTELFMKQTLEQYSNLLDYELGKNNVTSVFLDKNNEEAIGEYLFSIDSGEPLEIKNPGAKKVADIIYHVQESLRKAQNSVGADIGQLTHYMTTQTHDAEKLLYTADTFKERISLMSKIFLKNNGSFAAAREEMNQLAFIRWRNFIEPLLDWDKTFQGTDDIEGALRGAWEGLVSGKHGVLGDAEKNELPDIKRFKSLAKKAGEERKIFFKDSKSWLAYNRMYGQGTLQSSVINNIKRSAANYALMAKWGTTPQAMFASKLDKALTDYSRLPYANKRKITKLQAKLQSYFNMIDGTSYIPVNYLGAKIGSALRAEEATSKLGLIVFSSVPDLALRTEVFREMGGNLLGEYGASMMSILQGRPEGEMRLIANSLGVWAETSLGHMAAEVAPFNNPTGFINRMTGRFFKLTGIEWFDQTQRLSIATGLSNLMANQTYEGLSETAKSIYRMYGLEEAEWKLIHAKGNVWKENKGRRFITPDGAQYLTPESIANYLNKSAEELTPREIERVRNDMESRLRSYFLDRTNDANLRNDISNTAFFQSARPGSIEGELMRFFGQFKYYPINFAKRVLGRKIFGIKVDTYRGLQNGSPDIAGIMNIIIGTTVLGYISSNAKNVVKGKTIRDPRDPKAWIAALLQGGGLGIYGDFLFGQYDRFGHKITDSLMGPVPGTLNDVASLLFTLKQLEDPSAQALELLKNNLPFINLFYTRWALDYLFLNGFQEHINPGSTARREKRLYDQNGQSYWINPLAFDLTGA